MRLERMDEEAKQRKLDEEFRVRSYRHFCYWGLVYVELSSGLRGLDEKYAVAPEGLFGGVYAVPFLCRRGTWQGVTLAPVPCYATGCPSLSALRGPSCERGNTGAEL